MAADSHTLLRVLAWLSGDSFLMVALVSRAFQQAYATSSKGSTDTLLKLSTASPQLPQWAFDNGFTISEQTAYWAARWGHLPILQVAAANVAGGSGGMWQRSAYSLAHFEDNARGCAARYDHLDVVKWAYSQGQEGDRWTFAAAAAGDHLHVMQWLHSQQCFFDETAFRLGRGQALQWLHEHREQTKPCRYRRSKIHMHSHMHPSRG